MPSSFLIADDEEGNAVVLVVNDEEEKSTVKEEDEEAEDWERKGTVKSNDFDVGTLTSGFFRGGGALFSMRRA